MCWPIDFATASTCLQIGRAVLVGRRADGDELEQAVVDALLNVGRELEPACLDVAFHVVLEAGLVDRDLAVVEPRDLVFVDVDADDVVAHLRHAGTGDQADIARIRKLLIS